MARRALLALAALLAPAEGLVRAKQKAALVALYESTDGANWALVKDRYPGAPHPLWNQTDPELHPPGGNRGWDVRGDNSDPCSTNHSRGKAWYGVGCSDPCNANAGDASDCRHGEILSLELPWNGLKGTIPIVVAEELKRLHFLDLSHNDLSGTIPSEVGKLRMLNYFQLADNSLTGTIPTEVRTMGSHVPRDHLSGGNEMYHPDDVDCNASKPDPNPNVWRSSAEPCDYVGPNMIGPTVFDVGHNRLNGTLPTTMGELFNLHVVDVSHNSDLGGVHHLPQPHQVTEYKESWYERSFYEYTTAIPTELGLLWKLQALRMHESQFLRYMPTELGTLRSLTWLEMNGNGNHTSNQVSGTLPTQMGRLSNAVRVVVQENQLSGSIPPHIRNMSALMTLDMHENKLSGTIPDAYGGMTRLQYWDSFANRLEGDLPPSVFEAKELVTLYIQNEHSDAIRNHYCRERIEQSAHGRKHNYAELGSTHLYFKSPDHSMCVNPFDVAGTFERLSGDV